MNDNYRWFWLQETSVCMKTAFRTLTRLQRRTSTLVIHWLLTFNRQCHVHCLLMIYVKQLFLDTCHNRVKAGCVQILHRPCRPYLLPALSLTLTTNLISNLTPKGYCWYGHRVFVHIAIGQSFMVTLCMILMIHTRTSHDCGSLLSHLHRDCRTALKRVLRHSTIICQASACSTVVRWESMSIYRAASGAECRMFSGRWWWLVWRSGAQHTVHRQT